MTLTWTVLRDFLLDDVLGNLTSAALLTATAWSARKLRAARAARRGDRDRNSAE
ncbi:hypothetical protein [Streptomyces sp. NPDC058157]|uniref:hypothetical protein n=1 Tax=Streptomyces sp. NPDC058157 TaxID=3346360 RepID=UPI0036E15117